MTKQYINYNPKVKSSLKDLSQNEIDIRELRYLYKSYLNLQQLDLKFTRHDLLSHKLDGIRFVTKVNLRNNLNELTACDTLAEILTSIIIFIEDKLQLKNPVNTTSNSLLFNPVRIERATASFDSSIGLYLQLQKIQNKYELVLDFQGTFFCLPNAHKWMIDIVQAVANNNISVVNQNFHSFNPPHITRVDANIDIVGLKPQQILPTPTNPSWNYSWVTNLQKHYKPYYIEGTDELNSWYAQNSTCTLYIYRKDRDIVDSSRRKKELMQAYNNHRFRNYYNWVDTKKGETLQKFIAPISRLEIRLKGERVKEFQDFLLKNKSSKSESELAQFVFQDFAKRRKIRDRIEDAKNVSRLSIHPNYEYLMSTITTRQDNKDFNANDIKYEARNPNLLSAYKQIARYEKWWNENKVGEFSGLELSNRKMEAESDAYFEIENEIPTSLKIAKTMEYLKDLYK